MLVMRPSAQQSVRLLGYMARNRGAATSERDGERMSIRRRAIRARMMRKIDWDKGSDELKRVAARLKKLAEREANGERIPHEVALAALSDLDFPADKGKLHGACNRSACLARPASWFNTSTQAHYCRYCAGLINQACPRGDPICHPVHEEPANDHA